LHELREEHETAVLRAGAETEMREATSVRRAEHLGRIVSEARSAEISAATLRASCARAERDAARRGALLNNARAAAEAEAAAATQLRCECERLQSLLAQSSTPLSPSATRPRSDPHAAAAAAAHAGPDEVFTVDVTGEGPLGLAFVADRET
jgi:hypothetical protein